MPKSGWTYKSEVAKVKRALLTKTAKATRDTAKGIAKGAKERVPSPKNPGPDATGALKAIIHVVDGTPKSTGGDRSGRVQAINDARAANPKIDQHIEPGVDVSSPDPGYLVCAVDEPLDYAERIEKGGFDSAKGYRAPGPHLAPAEAAEDPRFAPRLDSALRAVERDYKL